MFQRSGPDHMLLYTVLKQKGARLNFTFTWESECEIQGKQKFTKILSWKKLFPPGQPGSLPNCPSPPLSSWPLHAEIFSSFAEDGDGWQRNEDPPGDKDCDDGAPLPLRLAGLLYAVKSHHQCNQAGSLRWP